MQSKAEFYLADVGEMNPKTGVMKVTPNVLHFALKRPHYADPEKIDTLYDNIAKSEHVEAYGEAYAAFMKEHPELNLPGSEKRQSIPAPSELVSEAPEVVESASESPVVDEIHRVKRSHPKKSVE